MDILREQAASKQFNFAYSLSSFDSRELFGFSRSGLSLGVARETFTDLFELAVNLFVSNIERNKGQIPTEDIQRLSYWIPKYYHRGGTRTNHIPKFFGSVGVASDEKLIFVTNDGVSIPRNSLSGRVTLTVTDGAREKAVQLGWRDHANEVKTATIREIKNINTDSFSARGAWSKRVDEDDD